MITQILFVTAMGGSFGGFLGTLALIALCFILGFVVLMFFAARETRRRKGTAKAP